MKSIHQKNGLASELGGITLIDAHHHLWNLDLHYYPWLKHYDPDSFLGDYTSLIRNYLPEDYLIDSSVHRVIGTVHCEADHDDNDEVAETRWVHQQAERYGFPNAFVAHAWFHKDNCEEILLNHLQFPLIRGIRSKPVTASSASLAITVKGVSGSMQDDKWLSGFSLLEKHNLSWDLRVPFWHLEEASEVAKTFPGTRIVLNHLGFPWDRSDEGLALWRKGMQALADCPNVMVKVSELGLRDRPWTIENNRGVVLETTDLFGMDRCMFASNFPVAGLQISYTQLVNNMSEILAGYSQSQREAFFCHNANAFYRMDVQLV